MPAITRLNKPLSDLIKDPSLFDAVEIQGARFTQDNSVSTDNEQPDFFSVFLHRKAGGTEWIWDCDWLAQAVALAKLIGDRHAWPVRDFVSKHHVFTLESMRAIVKAPGVPALGARRSHPSAAA